ncbi:MAG: DNA repair protein RecN [Spirochaetaceae bacterium 4572_59]|nr:MAG: DNA repair protein RecN [Spirochaetaceae bacterium 4572_59]
MIEELHIKNYALINENIVNFQSGLNILTGETGAGKSVLIGALGLILGNKGDSSVIRTGEDEADITAVFNISTAEIRLWLIEHDLDDGDDQLLIRRTLKRTGRGKVYIQGRPFPLAELSDLGRLLVDIHGQHDQQSLFHIEQHRRFLDRSGKHEEHVQEISEIFNRLKELNEKITNLRTSLNDKESELEILTFSLEEISMADIHEEEEEELRSRLKRIDQAEEFFTLVDSFLNLMPESRGGAMGALREAGQALEGLSGLDEENKKLSERFSNAFYEMEDIIESIVSLNNDISFDPQDKERLEDRLAEIKKIFRKYGPSYQDMQRYCEDSRRKLEELSGGENNLVEWEIQKSSLEEQLIRKALELSEKRKIRGSKLEVEIRDLLKTLGMASAEFSVQISRRTGDNGQYICGITGLDRVEFLFSANKGEPLKSLRHIASGGEISRIMLAIKTALSGTDHIPVLVFDEIDSGIGGEVGNSIGKHMKNLAQYNQILCITHLASIAVYADNHIKVEKTDDNDRTNTSLYPLKDESKVLEIARMLSGNSEGDASIRHAEVLLRTAAG